MSNQKKLVALALAAVVGGGITAVSGQAFAEKAPMEKCYGITKAGSNDCGGKGTGHSCQGQGKTNSNPNDWVYVPKGTCDKIVGASTSPSKADDQ